MDLRQHTRRDIVQEQWLADFLDWYDSQQRQSNGGGADAAGLVEGFLQTVDASIEDDARQALLELAADMLPVQRLTADAVTCWIDPAASAGGDQCGFLSEEALPRPFGDYELLERIGHGGMGIVYRARQTSLGRTVCVKMLPPGLLEPQRMQRLIEEARLAGRLHHPGIVPVFDAGSYRGQPYYAMELVEGETLSARIARQPLSAREAATALGELAAAVQFAHDSGVLHRDLKPANVLIDGQGRLRVTDFGLGRHVDDSASEAGVAGTPAYMAVEQVRGDATDWRTDVYGLGAILYEMLSGRPPHVGNSPAQTMRLVAEEPAIRLAQLRPGTPRDLETICHKCLEKHPQRRYQSAAALREDLDRFLRNEPVLARRARPLERSLRWAQRRPTVAIAGAISVLSLLMLLVGGAYALWSTQAALQRTQTAEESQRQLARQLAAAKQSSDAALYRSLIVQTVRSLETLDVEAARRSLKQIDTIAGFADSPPLEYRLLHRQAFPEIASWNAGEGSLRDGGWTGDGKNFVALLNQDGLAVFAEDGELRERASVHGMARGLAVHPDRAVAAVSDQGNVQIWDVSPLQLRSQVPVATALAVQIAWHPNGRELIVLGDDGVLRAIAVESGDVTPLAAMPEPLTRFAISPDGRWLAVVTQDNRVWAVASGPAAGRRAAGATSAAVPIASVGGWVVDLAWAMDDQRPAQSYLAVADDRGRVDIWGLSASREANALSSREIIATISGPAGDATLSWRGEELFIGHGAGQLSAINVRDPSLHWRHPCQPLKKVVVQPRGRKCWLLHQDSPAATLWDVSQLSVGVPIYSGRAPLRSITAGDQGRLTAWRDIDGKIGIVGPHHSADVTVIAESAVGASALAASPVAPLLAVTRGSDVVVYRTTSLEPVVQFTEHRATVWVLAFSPDGKWLASGDGDGRVGLVCIDLPEKSRLLETQGSEVRAVAFAPDAARLAIVDGDGQLTTWSVDTGERSDGLQIPPATTHALAYLTNSKLVIGDSIGRIRLVDLTTRSASFHWQVHDGPVWSIAVVGPRLLSSGQDGGICISDTLGNIYHSFPKQSSAVWSVAYDIAGDRVIAATVAGHALCWQARVKLAPTAWDRRPPPSVSR